MNEYCRLINNLNEYFCCFISKLILPQKIIDWKSSLALQLLNKLIDKIYNEFNFVLTKIRNFINNNVT